CHIGQLECYSLVVHDLCAESLPGFRIFPCQLVCTSSNTECLRCYTDTATSQGFHRELKSESIFTNTVLFRNFYVGKHYRVRIATADAEFIFFSRNGNAGPVFLNDESIDALRTF